MKITIVRSGGFAAISLPPKSIETEDNSIKELVKEIVGDKDAPSSSEYFYDTLNYSIAVEDGEYSASIDFRGKPLPPKAKKLVDIVCK